MDIGTIIAEADVRVPNSLASAQKVTFLNEVNNEFFDIVKIPKTATFTTAASVATYLIGADVRAKNITKVIVGKSLYPSFLYEDVGPGLNYHLYDESTGNLILSPVPTRVGLAGIVKYLRPPTTAFVTGTLTAQPDAPAEYHWVYILGLCEKIALAIDDVPRSANYGQQYRAQLSIAQANYAQANQLAGG